MDIAPEQRAPYVIFERQAVEDRAATIEHGRYMTKDVDFAVVTPIGSKDRIPKRVDEWFKMMEQYVQEERIPAKWPQQYKEAYNAWKAGLEIPLDGTPIKGWSVLSPSQQTNVLGANIRTVEDLAQINDEAGRRIGMGAIELRDKAIAWLKVSRTIGATTQEMVVLQGKVKQLEKQVIGLTENITLLKNENLQLTQDLIEAQKRGHPA